MAHLEVFRVSRHGEPGAGAEGMVRTALCAAFRMGADGDGVLYEQYPVWHGKFFRVPDLLLLSSKLGLVNFEVKGLRTEQLTAIHGDRWDVRNYFDPVIHPFAQGQAALDLLLKTAPDSLPRPARRLFVALPFVSRSQCACVPSTPDPRILWTEDFEAPHKLWDRLRLAPAQASYAPALGASAWQHWRDFLGRRAEENLEGAKRPRFTKREVVDQRLAPFEGEREAELRGHSLEVPSGVLRLRGIAGSGKTVLLTQMAAWLLDRCPHFRIGLVFSTRSLHEQCFSLTQENLRVLLRGTGREPQTDPVQRCLRLPDTGGSIQVFNAWGSTKTADGFYSFMCQQVNSSPLDFRKAREAYRQEFHREPAEGDLLPFVCRQLLASHGDQIVPCFDALFIDEGQDLLASSPTLRWDDPDGNGGPGTRPGQEVSDDARSEPFFTLVYRALTPCDPDSPRQRRLVFAYDEAQSLDSLHIPSSRRLFGPVLAGLFAGGKLRNRIMRKSYRNPKPILVAAHALGMGLRRTGGAVQTLTKAEWEAVGYEVVGDLRRSDRAVTLLRADEHSPNPVPHCWRGAPGMDLMTCYAYKRVADEMTALRAAVKSDLEDEGLDPSRDLLVIDLRGKPRLVADALNGLPYRGSKLRCFVLGKDAPRDVFRRPGQLTIAGVRRAKGNEAPMVYVVGLEELRDPAPDDPNAHEELIRRRNRLFVCFTRARGWLRLSGVRVDPAAEALFVEVDAVNHHVLDGGGGTLEFTHQPDGRARSLAHEEQTELF